MPSHRISNANDVRSGNAVSAGRQILGVPVSNLVRDDLGTPTVAAAGTVVTTQAVAGAGLVTKTATIVTLDVARGVNAVSSNAGDTTQNVIVVGTDIYGMSTSERLNLNGTTTVVGKKAFKTIISVTASAALTGNLSVGQTGILGLNYRLALGGFIIGKLSPNTADAGTVAVADSTSPATNLTGDVRGTYLPAGTLNGANRFVAVYIALNGPDDTDGFGVAQV